MWWSQNNDFSKCPHAMKVTDHNGLNGQRVRDTSRSLHRTGVSKVKYKASAFKLRTFQVLESVWWWEICWYKKGLMEIISTKNWKDILAKMQLEERILQKKRNKIRMVEKILPDWKSQLSQNVMQVNLNNISSHTGIGKSPCLLNLDSL